MEALTVPNLRRLARLHRQGVDGAHDELLAIIGDRSLELPALLGFPASKLERLRTADDPAEVLVATIEHAARARRETTALAQRTHARALAAEVAEETVTTNGTWRVPFVKLVLALAAWPGRGVVVFGRRGAADVGRLRAALRLTANARPEVGVTEDRVVVRYATAISRGRLALVLMRDAPMDDALVVPIVEHAVVEDSVVEEVVADDPSPRPALVGEVEPATAARADCEVQAEATPPVQARVPDVVPSPTGARRPTRRPFLDHLTAALAATLGGAT